ncbi:MarR family transcriptional regulator [Amnibacterium endophyticum]|uniref:MarR family transcriptional regulator n=1 Tax=Amnibacterium endophyticum TaxID=2109337 RepID=A0ABW4LHA4_9MICO
MTSQSDLARAEAAVGSVLDALLDLEIAERLADADLGGQFGLNPTELTALAILGRSGTQQVMRLAGLLQLTAGSTSTLVTRLADRELISRQRSDQDRRSVDITLTEAGASVVQAMGLRYRSAVEAALAGATTECLLATSGILRAAAAELGRTRDVEAERSEA